MSPNLPSKTIDAFKNYESAGSDSEKIRALEEYHSTIPKHKGTEKERGKLKRKIALLRAKIQKKASASGGGGGIGVKKEGAAQIVLVGYPNAGKSCLISEITNVESKIGSYAFTTLTPIVGMLPYKGIQMQIVDLPGLISGAAEGKGMGKQFLSVIRNSDITLFLLDAADDPIDKLDSMLKEFRIAGIRLNAERPDVKIYKKDRGGIEFLGKQFLKADINDAKEALRDFGIVNCTCRLNKKVSLEDFIDSIDKSVVWKKAFVLLTKVDKVSQKELNLSIKTIKKLYSFDVCPISSTEGINLDELIEKMWVTSDLIRIYTPESKRTDEEPLVIKRGSTVMGMAQRIHSDFVEKFNYARIWGKSAKYEGQRVGKDHVLLDGDTVELITL